jgi:outer membrane lipoprotein SlyB
VGGLLGSSVGGGSGRTAATVAGAVGGAVVGNNLEGNGGRRDVRYEVVVRYANGATRSMTYDNDPGVRVGDQVRVDGNRIAHY